MKPMSRYFYPSGSQVLFSGKGFYSGLIKWGQNIVGLDPEYAKISHVGQIVWIDEVPHIFESTSLSNVKDIEGNFKSGPQIVNYANRVNSYKGGIYIRAFRSLNGVDLTKPILKLYDEFKEKKYETSEWELACSIIDIWPFKSRKDLSSIFCSEQNAELLIREKLLSPKKPSNEYGPGEFGYLQPLKGEFGRMERIK